MPDDRLYQAFVCVCVCVYVRSGFICHLREFGKVNFSTVDFLDKKILLKIFNCLTHSLQEQAYGYGGKDRGKG